MWRLYFGALLLWLSACTTSQPSLSQSNTYKDITPTFFWVGAEGARAYVTLTDTITHFVPLPADTEVLVSGYESQHWAVLYYKGMRYYTRKRRLNTTSASGKSYSTPSYYTPSSSASSPSPTYHNVQTGPRGGHYYINKNGNKTYIKRR